MLRNFCLACLLLFSFAYVEGQTVLSGCVIDADSEEVLPYVNIVLYKNGKMLSGAISNEDGTFTIRTKSNADSVCFSSIGYVHEGFVLTKKKYEGLVIKMRANVQILQTTTVTAERSRYRRKGNPAVELMKKVLEHRDSNHISSKEFYEYRSHRKTEISLLGISDSLRYNRMFKNLQYVFDNVNTSPLSDKSYLPVYFTEQLTENYYRRKTNSEKKMIIAQQEVEISKFLDPQSLENLLSEIVDQVDIYENKIHILSNDFLSPLSTSGVLLYHFFLGDTVCLDNGQCVKLMFNPSNARDIGFSGTLWISLDGTYRVVAADLGIHKKSGINFVESLSIKHEYEYREGVMIKTREDICSELSIYGLQLFVRQKTLYDNYVFDKQREDAFYSSYDLTERLPGYNKKMSSWWEENRIEQLTESEKRTYENSAKLNNYTAYKVILKTVMAFTSGYVEIGKIDLGPIENTVSWNDVEGLRLRVGGKTNMKFNRNLFFEGFVAYGFGDERFKFRTKAMYNFADKVYHQWEFPKNLISLSYEENTNIQGQHLLMGTPDRLFLSFNRGNTDKMSFDKTLRLEYEYETLSQMSFKVGVQYKRQQALDNLVYESFDGTRNFGWINNPSVDFEFRYAKGEKFYQQQQYRMTINTTAPIFTFNYSYGTKLLSGDWSYHSLKAVFQKRFYLWTFGYGDIALEGGKIFGQVPFPLMFVHHANQNWAYQDEAFNLMNYYEFVSDTYVQFMFNYNFNGVILNRIPLINKLNLRECFAFKAVWGGVAKDNMPGEGKGYLMDFPRDENGNYTTFALNNGPYIEANIGLDNIFKVLRLDYVRRFTYLDNPNIAKWGIRFRLRFTF